MGGAPHPFFKGKALGTRLMLNQPEATRGTTQINHDFPARGFPRSVKAPLRIFPSRSELVRFCYDWPEGLLWLQVYIIKFAYHCTQIYLTYPCSNLSPFPWGTIISRVTRVSSGSGVAWFSVNSDINLFSWKKIQPLYKFVKSVRPRTHNWVKEVL